MDTFEIREDDDPTRLRPKFKSWMEDYSSENGKRTQDEEVEKIFFDCIAGYICKSNPSNAPNGGKSKLSIEEYLEEKFVDAKIGYEEEQYKGDYNRHIIIKIY